VHALDLDVEDGVQLDDETHLLADQLGQALFVVTLDTCANLPRTPCHPRELLEFTELVQVGHPLVTDAAGDKRREGRVGLEQPAALGDAVGLVVETFWEHAVEIRHHGGFQQFAVKSRDTVGRVASQNSQLRHADLRVVPSSNKDMRRRRSKSPGYLAATSLRKRALMSWMISKCRAKALAKRARGHVLERFGQKSMVGVGQSADGDVPSFFPSQAFLIHQHTHQFSHRDGRVGVVHLDGDRIG
jgi:hypothetical protein